MSVNKTLILLTLLFDFTTTPPCTAAMALPDSLLSIEQAYTYDQSALDTSLAIVNTLRERQLEPEWRLLIAEGNLYRNAGFFHESIDRYEQALETSEVQADYHQQARIWQGMMLCHEMLIDELPLMDDIFHMRQLSEKCNNPAIGALAEFVMGKRLHMHNQKDSAYQSCLGALEIIRQNELFDKDNVLRYCYVTLTKMYRLDHRYDEALQMARQAEAVIKKPVSSVESCCSPAQWLRSLYAIKASLLAECGREAQADAVYQQFVSLPEKSANGDIEVVPYLLYRDRPDEALEIINRYKTYLKSEGDSIEFRMLKAYIEESHAYSLKGDYVEVTRRINDMAVLASQLFREVSRVEMSARSASLHEKDQLYKRNMWLLGAAITLLALLVITTIVLVYKHRSYESQMKLQRAMNLARAYQKAVLKADEEAERLQVLLPHETEVGKADETAGNATTAESPKGTLQLPSDKDDDAMLFVLLDKQVTRRRLFLNPNLSRDDLMRLIGVDKNRIGHIIARYSEASNVSTYINQKRAAFAAEYIKRHPEYTIAAVAEACGMTNAVTLNRTFKDIYGITPSMYRQNVTKGKIS